ERAAIDELAEAVTYAHVIGSQITMTVVLDYAIDVLAYLGHAEAAAVLAGAVGDNAVFAANPAEGPEEDRRRRAPAHARASIGDDAYELAVERGMAMTADEVRTWLLDTIGEVQSREVAGE